MNEFLDVFPRELLGLPLKQEVEFTIDLSLSMESPYQMVTVELKELKEQLQDLLDKGLFNQVLYHGEPQCYLLKRRMDHYIYVLTTNN